MLHLVNTRFKPDLVCMRFASPYGPLLPFYATLARWYSGGAIPACQRWAVSHIPVGSRVLFAGPGPGTDVAWAAGAGLSVTAVDSCAAMLRLTRLRLRRAGVEHGVDLKHADVLQLPQAGQYDAVVAQFFLNVFAPERLSQVLANLAGHLNPDGRLIVGDFASSSGGRHFLQRAYHDLPMSVFARFGANAKHAIHDLPAHLSTAGFVVGERRKFPLFGIGPGWIEGLVAEPIRHEP